MTPVPDLTVLSSSEKDTLIATLLAQVQAQAEQINALMARVAALEAENAAFRPRRGARRMARARPSPRRTRARIGPCIPIQRAAATFWRSAAPIAPPM